MFLIVCDGESGSADRGGIRTQVAHSLMHRGRRRDSTVHELLWEQQDTESPLRIRSGLREVEVDPEKDGKGSAVLS